jgi:hypothetical protein
LLGGVRPPLFEAAEQDWDFVRAHENGSQLGVVTRRNQPFILVIKSRWGEMESNTHRSKGFFDGYQQMGEITESTGKTKIGTLA